MGARLSRTGRRPSLRRLGRSLLALSEQAEREDLSGHWWQVVKQQWLRLWAGMMDRIVVGLDVWWLPL
jgi:hypothetical protein